ncbi:hypothetical protein [Sulfobacillus thermosulfidooxidans]|uniref:hypothetical protein n=1 Tax=Sulfobacillus thermosulfidooxidans TaxID=28034 RepID=UPI0012FE53E6|nr:hypothetical protein [Sulfobacillus thermosulfidooxidans]
MANKNFYQMPIYHSQRWHVTIIRPTNYVWSHVFNDVAQMFVYELLREGAIVSYQDNNLRSDAQNIVLGSHLLPSQLKPVLDQTRVILYNLEQLPTQLAGWKDYEILLRTYPIWDYHTEHVTWMKDTWGIHARHVPLGYVPTWTRIPSHTTTDIDILFFGIMSSRRQAILNELQKTGLQVVATDNAFGPELDALIARSRIILNVHQFSENSPLEELRLYYLWANRRAVVSEALPHTVPTKWQNSAKWVPYADLVHTCVELLQHPNEIVMLQESGFETLRQHPFTLPSSVP